MGLAIDSQTDYDNHSEPEKLKTQLEQLAELCDRYKPKDEDILRGLAPVEDDFEEEGKAVIVLKVAGNAELGPEERRWILDWNNGTGLLFYLMLFMSCQVESRDCPRISKSDNPYEDLKKLEEQEELKGHQGDKEREEFDPVILRSCWKSPVLLQHAEMTEMVIRSAWSSTYSVVAISYLWLVLCSRAGTDVWQGSGTLVKPGPDNPFLTLSLIKPTNPLSRTVSLWPDYEIHLKPANKCGSKPLVTFHVHRFLLHLRIPYYKVLFESNFGDANTYTSTFYTEDFSASALRTVLNYVYMPMSNYNSLILDPPPGPEVSRTGPRNEDGTPNCTFRTERGFSLLQNYIELLRAATYFQVDDLRQWAIKQIGSYVHDFQCTGRGCSILIPQLMDFVVDDDCIDTNSSFKTNFLALYGSYRHINSLWKRPLITVHNEEVLTMLVDCIKVNYHQSSLREVYNLCLTLARLRTATKESPLSTKWESKLILPLVDFTTTRIVKGLGDKELVAIVSTALSGQAGLVYLDVLELLEFITKEKLTVSTCQSLWSGLVKINEALSDEELSVDTVVKERMEKVSEICSSWFRKNWLSLSVTPAKIPARPRSPSEPSVEMPPLPGNHGSTNFFSAWNPRMLQALSNRIKVTTFELLALDESKVTTRIRKPPVTPVCTVGDKIRGRSRPPIGRPGTSTRYPRGPTAFPPVGRGQVTDPTRNIVVLPVINSALTGRGGSVARGRSARGNTPGNAPGNPTS